MKWWRVVPAGGVVLLLAFSYRDLWQVLGAWFSGRSASGLVLWGVPMVWWGRTGKVLQFAGGLVVVLDLVGPDRLRRAGAEASARVRAFRDWRALARRRQELIQLVWQIKEQVLELKGLLVWEIVTEPAKPLPDQPWITAAMVDELRTAIVDDLVRQYGLPGPPEQLGDLQANFAYQRVDEFVREALPEPERALLDQPDTTWRLANRIAAVAIIVVGFLLGGAWTYVANTYLYDSDIAFTVIFGWCAICFGVGVVFVHFAERAPFHVLARSMFVASTATLVAKVMDRAAPGHQLRWFAFYLFLTGFGLDLLAS